MKINRNNIICSNGFAFTLIKTVRIPEDGNVHQLPPGLGTFPVERVEDFKDKLPPSWVEHGGVFIPMFEKEAMWIKFHGETSAIKVATGKVNAVNGKEWCEELKEPTHQPGLDPEQDYMVGPNPQNWIDGFNVGGDRIRQFVAMEQGKGYTVEGQVTGKEEVGGLQVIVYPMKEEKKPKYSNTRSRGIISGALLKEASSDSGVTIPSFESDFGGCASMSCDMEMPTSYSTIINGSHSKGGTYDLVGTGYSKVISKSASNHNLTEYKGPPTLNDVDMIPTKYEPPKRQEIRQVEPINIKEVGLAQGGTMVQKIYADPYSIDFWDQTKSERIFIHIMNATQWEEITGKPCPSTPTEATEYKGAWFTHNLNQSIVDGSSTLSAVKTISDIEQEKGLPANENDAPYDETKNNPIVSCIPSISANTVVDGDW